MIGVDGLLAGRPVLPESTLRGGRVTKVDGAGGVYVTTDGGDERHPLGPCAGARYRPVADCSGDPHTHPLQPIPRGARVLLAITDAGPWVVSWEEPT